VGKAQIVYRASSIPGLHAAARAGLGVAALPCFMGDADAALVMPPIPEMASTLWLLTQPDLRRTARVRTVLDVLAERLAPHGPLFSGERARSVRLRAP